MPASVCLSDEELASPATALHLAHLETCDACREIWLCAHADAPADTWTVGRYEVRGTLGAGGLGVVLLGWDPGLRREVAIKFSSGGGSLREAQALAAIRHPNVVAVHDVGEHDGDVYITMERARGSTLDTWWLGASLRERVRALLDIAAGLIAIHAAGLVHCDLKPGNVVVTPAGDVVIVDLGLATPHGDAPAFAGGTPGFVAPEVMRGGPPTAASDEYAFWCVVRQCLASAPMSARQRRRLAALIARGTADDPARRFGSLAACAHALRTWSTPRTRYLVAGGTLLAAAGVAAVMLTRSSAAPTCVVDLPAAPDVRAVLANRPEVLARVEAFVARERSTGSALLARACAADAHDGTWVRVRGCVLDNWRAIDGHLRAIAGRRGVAHSLDELPLGVPLVRCAPGAATANPPAVALDATPTSLALYGAITAGAGDAPAPRLRSLAMLRPAVLALANPGLSAAFQLELAEAHERAGAQRDALAAATAASELAARNGDDIVHARAQLTAYMLRAERDGDEAGEVEAIVTRVGSPGMTATFHDIAAQRALALGDIPRAQQLFEQALATLTTLELAPSARHGAVLQNLGVALQYQGNFAAAQEHFDRAVTVLTARYGAHHDQALGAQLVANHCRIYRAQQGSPALAAEGEAGLAAIADELATSDRGTTALAARVAFARCQGAQVRDVAPLARCSDALAIARRVFGANSVELVPSLVAVGQLTMRTNVRGSLPVLEEAVTIAEKQANHPTDLPYARGLYALALKVSGRTTDGLAIAKLAITDLERFGQRGLVDTLRAQFPTL